MKKLILYLSIPMIMGSAFFSNLALASAATTGQSMACTPAGGGGPDEECVKECVAAGNPYDECL